MALQNMGLEFFYLSVDFFDNDKVLLVEQECGSRATLLAVRLLARIYRNGFYYRWGKDECLLFTRRLPGDYTAEYVQRVVDALLERGFFDRRLYGAQGVLTSESIQRHYFEAVQRRKLVEVEAEYLLVDVGRYRNVCISGENADTKPENVDFAPQSKGKETKGEEKKAPPSAPPGGKGRTVEEILAAEPQDGKKRNAQGLVESLRRFGAKEEDIVRLLPYCNYGVIGHPVWMAIADIHNAGGKIQQPVKYIWSRLRSSTKT